tara:strand:- start:300 stop:635 length:336 start_codon:yes stop_codon:yes gene_type:complete
MSEAQIQQQIVVWFRNNYCLKHHNNRCCIFSVPNEAGYKNRNFTLTGMMSGVSDLIVVIPNKTIYIELKTATGKQSPKQKDFEQTIKNLNQEYYLCRSLKDFQLIIKKYLV